MMLGLLQGCCMPADWVRCAEPRMAPRCCLSSSIVCFVQDMPDVQSSGPAAGYQCAQRRQHAAAALPLLMEFSRVMAPFRMKDVQMDAARQRPPLKQCCRFCCSRANYLDFDSLPDVFASRPCVTHAPP